MNLKSKQLLLFGFVLCNLFPAVDFAFAQGLTVFVPSTYNVGLGREPNCVVAADVNGDGKLDLITANYFSFDNGLGNTLTVLTNNGSGVFGSNATLTVGGGPYCVVAADINGDGKVDLISVSTNTLTVLTNNGIGVFGSNATLTVGNGPTSVAAADVNGDGKVDLITANFNYGSGNTLTVLTNNGKGVFGSNATLTVGSGPRYVVASDVNGDGKLDLISANYGGGNGNTLTVLTNNGKGVFGSNATLTVGSGPYCVVAADVNGDGKLDLISANYGDGNGNTLTVLTNNGIGVFGSNATLTVGLGPRSIVAADLYGHGKLDLISANINNGTLTVLTNNGTGVFGSNTTLNILNISSPPRWVVAADVNNDGKLDLICANLVDCTLTVLTQIPGPPPLIAFVSSTFAVSNGPNWVVATDVNGDGKLDLISANYGTSDNGGGFTLTVLTNNGNGVFGFNATLNLSNSLFLPSPICVAAADINGDGKPDLISVNLNSDTLTVLTNNGSGCFGSNATLNVGISPIRVAIADINGDGKPDLICVNMVDNTLTVLTNNGGGIFSSNATLKVGFGPRSIAVTDINGNGKPDLIVANAVVNTLTVLTNNGNGSFGSNATLAVGNYPACVVGADINGDGKPDLICANYKDNTLTVLTNNGYGIFGSNATLFVGSGPRVVTVADVNEDGKPDLICANQNDNTVTVLTNNGSGIFGLYATLTVGEHPSCVVAADVNNDGRLDLITANQYTNTLTLLTQVIVGPPMLTITPTNNTVVVSWSSFSTSFALQTNSNLTTTNWLPAGYTVSTTNGTNESATITPPPGNLFFRLVQ